MVISDLKTNCTHCNGLGRTAAIKPLGISQINFSGQCPHCSGRGFTLTELGEDVLKLMRPFMKEIVRSLLLELETAREKAEEKEMEEPPTQNWE